MFYVGSFRFPEGDAGAARVLGTGKALRDAGAAVVFAGWEAEGRKQDLQADGSFQFEGFRYVSQGELRHAPLSPPRRLAGAMLAGTRTLRWLADQPSRRGDAVIAYQGGTYFLSRLRGLCRARQLRLVLDCTEWYAPRQFPGGRVSPAWWDAEFATRLVKPSAGRAIVVSTFLEQYFASRGCAALRVPPLVDLQATKWRAIDRPSRSPNSLALAYAGTPGRKDLLANLLCGLAMLRAQGHAVALNLFGPNRETLEQTDGRVRRWLEALGDTVVFHGAVPQPEVPGRLMKSDFTVLLRPDARFSRAGFPTKVAESLAAGVPVVVNPIGDLSLYVEDGREGILLRDESPESVVSGLRRALALPPSAWQSMSEAARRRAAASFDYRRHVEPIRQFVLEPGCPGGPVDELAGEGHFPAER